MKPRSCKSVLCIAFLLQNFFAGAQLQVTPMSDPMTLIQRLIGEGVIVSNATITIPGPVKPTGLFNVIGGVNIGIDSGIVLTSGRAKSDLRNNLYGVDGNGTFTAASVLADNDLGLPGDISLANELGIPIEDIYDAVALEFDFIPLGDSIKFRYVMSSEEYTAGTVCTYNDAFGFFISGPGITGSKNIALIPGTNTPVTITNVNNITTATCVNNPQYYIDKTSNKYMTHEGHTTVFTATSRVQPCETYHLKLVVADVGDYLWDTGIFLEAGSLTSSKAELTNQAHTDASGNYYLAEGCAPGSFVVRRPGKYPVPMNVSLSYGGTVTNGVDVQTLPASVNIPANDSFVVVSVLPIADGMPEGIELLKVYVLATCAAATPTDSIIIQLRDYDTLGLVPDSAMVCAKQSVQLTAAPGYTNYQWSNRTTLTNAGIPNPVANPVKSKTVYVCTATDGSCQAQDSVIIKLKNPDARIFAGNDTTTVYNRPLQLQATDVSNVGLLNYSWSPNIFFSNPNIAAPVITLTNDQQFVVKALTPLGCEVADDIFVKAFREQGFYVPSGFTPNNDGLNDILKAVAVGFKEFRYFRVFNRWGELIFSTRDSNKGWDGKLMGKEQPAGTYVWTAEVIDSKGDLITQKGIVTIIR